MNDILYNMCFIRLKSEDIMIRTLCHVVEIDEENKQYGLGKSKRFRKICITRKCYDFLGKDYINSVIMSLLDGNIEDDFQIL